MQGCIPLASEVDSTCFPTDAPYRHSTSQLASRVIRRTEALPQWPVWGVSDVPFRLGRLLGVYFGS